MPRAHYIVITTIRKYASVTQPRSFRAIAIGPGGGRGRPPRVWGTPRCGRETRRRLSDGGGGWPCRRPAPERARIIILFVRDFLPRVPGVHFTRYQKSCVVYTTARARRPVTDPVVYDKISVRPTRRVLGPVRQADRQTDRQNDRPPSVGARWRRRFFVSDGCPADSECPLSPSPADRRPPSSHTNYCWLLRSTGEALPPPPPPPPTSRSISAEDTYLCPSNRSTTPHLCTHGIRYIKPYYRLLYIYSHTRTLSYY